MRSLLIATLFAGACSGPPERAVAPVAPPPPRNVERAVAPASDEVPFTSEPAPAIDPSCGERAARGLGLDDLLAFGTDEGIVVRTRAVVPGTEGRHVPTSTYCFYLQADPDAAPEAVYSVRASHAPAVAGVIGSDTVVFFDTGAEVTVRLVRADGPARTFRGELDGEQAIPIGAWDDGVLLQRVRLNESAPLTFVPWSEHGLALARRVEVAGPEDAPSLQRRVCRSGDRLVWTSSRLHVYELASGERRAHDVGAALSSGGSLAVCDGELAVLAGVPVGGSSAFVIETGAPLPARLPADPIAVRHRYAYVARAAPTARVSYDLVRYDLEVDGAAERVARGLASGRGMALRSGLYLPEDGAGWRRVEWTTR